MQLWLVRCLAHAQTVGTLSILISFLINCPLFASSSHFAPVTYAGPLPLSSQCLNLRAPVALLLRARAAGSSENQSSLRQHPQSLCVGTHNWGHALHSCLRGLGSKHRATWSAYLWSIFLPSHLLLDSFDVQAYLQVAWSCGERFFPGDIRS